MLVASDASWGYRPCPRSQGHILCDPGLLLLNEKVSTWLVQAGPFRQSMWEIAPGTSRAWVRCLLELETGTEGGGHRLGVALQGHVQMEQRK